ncbi:hypothetical protein [Parashewanella tropica]|uniref:hypothetical protein n=1 Tax=Parashewanella tropica TaxID=2547970 RepID=UPI00105A86BF|nr:hypothetical protein [Parashewanella tropica]
MATCSELTQAVDNTEFERSYYHSIIHNGLEKTHESLKVGDAYLCIKPNLKQVGQQLTIFVEGFETSPSAVSRRLHPHKAERYDRFKLSESAKLLDQYTCIINHPNVRANALQFQAFHLQHQSKKCSELCRMVNELPSSVSQSLCPSKEELGSAYLVSLRVKGAAKTSQAFYCKGMHFTIKQQGSRYHATLISSQLSIETANEQATKNLIQWLNDESSSASIKLAELEHQRAFLLDCRSAVTTADIEPAGANVCTTDVGDFEIINMGGVPPCEDCVFPQRQNSDHRGSSNGFPPLLSFLLNNQRQESGRRDRTSRMTTQSQVPPQQRRTRQTRNIGFLLGPLLLGDSGGMMGEVLTASLNFSFPQRTHPTDREFSISYIGRDGRSTITEKRSLQGFIRLIDSYKNEHPQVALEIVLKIKGELPRQQYQESHLAELEQSLEKTVAEKIKIPALLVYVNSIPNTDFTRVPVDSECCILFHDLVGAKVTDIIEMRTGSQDDNWKLTTKDSVEKMLSTWKKITNPFYMEEMTTDHFRKVTLKKHLR